MLDLGRDLHALIVQHLNAGTADTELLDQVQYSINHVRADRQSRSDAANMRARLRYHLFIDPRGQRYRVSVNDLPAFCSEHRLNQDKMLELSNGGRGGLAEIKQWRRGPGSNPVLNGQPNRSVPEADPSLDDETTNAGRRTFKQKPA